MYFKLCFYFTLNFFNINAMFYKVVVVNPSGFLQLGSGVDEDDDSEDDTDEEDESEEEEEKQDSEELNEEKERLDILSYSLYIL